MRAAHSHALVTVITCVGTLGACRAPAPTHPPVVRLIATDHAFQAPTELPAGPVTLRLVNQGHTWHEALLVALADGASAESYLAAAKAGADFPAGAVDLGGPGVIGPGDSAEVVLNLTTGPHAVVCWTANHVRSGMIAAFQVIAPPSSLAAPPHADVELDLQDFHYAMSRPFRHGHQILHVTNHGARVHEVAIYRLADGRSVADFGAWLTSHNGPPPAWPAGGVASMAIGREAWATVVLPPGRYFMACGVPEGEQIHAQLGMLEEFTIS